MSDRQVQIEKFASAIRQLKILDSVSLERFLSFAQNASDQSLIAILSEVGEVSPHHVDMVDILARGDEAIPGYQIHDVIGSGGMGVVWRAKQKSLDRFVALKTISAVLQNNPQAIARFEREAVTIARLSHPNIVTALDFGKHRDRLFLAMEVVNGQDLGEYLDRNGAIPEKVAWGIAQQVASGLAHASREGVIHRDIKPANILILLETHSGISPTGIPVIKITDFGLALLNATDQPLDARLTSTGAAIGSPHYMAPEQFGGEGVDTRTDIYALGATVFQMLTGNPPWNGKSLPQVMGDKLSGKQPPFDQAIFKVHPRSLRLVQRMMASEVESRPESCLQLLVEIEEVLAEIGRTFSAVTANSLGTLPEPSKQTDSRDKDDTTEFQVVDLINSTNGNFSATPVPTRELSADLVANKSTATASLLKSKFALFALAIAVALGGLWGILQFLPGSPTWQPVALELDQNSEASPVQVFLFDGEKPFNPPYNTHGGSWIVQDGWLVADSSSPRNWINYQLPDWDFFKVELILRGNGTNLIDVAFGGAGAGEKMPQYSVRFQDGQAQLGVLTKIYGEFKPVGQPMKLIAGREEHFVEIQRNQGGWVVRLYRSDELQSTAPFLDGFNPSNELTLASQKVDTSSIPSSSELDSAFSELSVARMKPAD